MKAPEPQAHRAITKPDMLWGLDAISYALGVSAKTAKRWADEGKAPISRPAGRYFARRSELNAWLRGTLDKVT